ncbi:hypothetical protein RJ639_013320 [Escallonia herrerae]|uniref:Uncharacterized protein n=1 Tax=Escallonia herrerae TaxID=1293975 RepID=A0AA89AMF7_9ASTE|nr:hypothetical protein RJ639_013320 [Escallonia herrerae]
MAFVTLKDMGSDFHCLERFDGGDFVRWQRKMHFLLVTVKVYYLIVNPRPPEPGENEEESVAKTRERLRWDQDDEICRGHILNGMSNTLFDAYHTVKTAKELWNQLERRYITEDATSKRFIVSKFFYYKMVDGRSIMEQFNEIKSILDRYSQHKLALDEFIVVTSIIDKLPPSWKNFRNSLKHRKEDINLDELGTHLQIEEDLRKEEKSKSEGVSKILAEGEEAKREESHIEGNWKSQLPGRNGFSLLEMVYVHGGEVVCPVNCSSMSDDLSYVDVLAFQPLKRSASVGPDTRVSGHFLNQSSPSGSDISDSGLPGLPLSSHVFRSVPRPGVIAPLVQQIEPVPSSSTTTDPFTSLTLSLPRSGSEMSEISDQLLGWHPT